jgi:CyaY protein
LHAGFRLDRHAPVQFARFAGIPLGVYATLHCRRQDARLAMAQSRLGVSLPTFLIGIVLIELFRCGRGCSICWAIRSASARWLACSIRTTSVVVRYVADDVAVMSLGRLVKLAPKAELLAAPRHPSTRMLPGRGAGTATRRARKGGSSGPAVQCDAGAAAAGRPGELAPCKGAGGAAGRLSSGALGRRDAGFAATPACAGRYSGPFWPHAASASASPNAYPHKTAPRARAARPAKLDPWRSFISPILSIMSITTLQDTEYQAVADRVLAAIERQCDDWLQQGVIDIDTHRAGGLVELEFPDGSKVVVNKQPPLHEIWLAARNGGFHFKWDGSAWRDTRDGVDFFARLSDEASRQAGQPLRFASV